MAKKYQKRAHIQERRAKEEKAKLEKRQAYYQANKDKIWTIVLSAAIAVIVLALALDYFITPGGSMRIFLGNLMGVEDNMIINNVGNSKSPRYFNYGTMETPEGYLVIDGSYASDDRDQTFYYHDETEDKVIREIYIAGVDENADAILETVKSSNLYITTGEVKEGTIADLPVKYLYTTSAKGDKSGEEYASLAVYSDVLKDYCVSFFLSSFYDLPENLPTEEAMVAAAEKIIGCYHLPQ